jgi:thiamine pyrophosphate-dependent acetolactate synthase large subunit-like protein
MPIDLAIVADVNVTLKELADAVKSLVAKDRLQKIRAERLDVVTRAVAEAKATREADAQRNFNQDPIHPDRLDYELAKAVDKHAIVAMETLSSKDDFMNYGYREDEKMRLWSNGTSLGWGIGSSMGAQLAAPDRQVVLSIGDGSLMYSASGFWTQARYGIPVLTVVWNNRNYQTVRLGFDRYGGRMAETGHYHGMYLGDPDIDYVGLAASQGVGGIRVNSVSELEGALRKGVQTTLDGKPFLIDVSISRIGGGADSTWHRDFKLTDQRKMKA